MLNRIIRILATTLGTLLLFAGCSKTSYDPTPERVISFSAGSSLLRDDNVSKSSSPLTESVHSGVFAYFQSGTDGSPGSWSLSKKPDFMFNLDVGFNSSTGVYSYAPTLFWPDPVNTLSFWAYSPYVVSPDLREANSNTTYTSNSTGLPDIGVTVDGHTDFRVTNLVQNQSFDNTNSGYDGTVLLPFNHTLSLIDVNVEKNDISNYYTVTMKSVRFDGLFMTGLLMWDSSSNTWDWASLSGSRQNVTVWADDPNTNSDDVVLVHETPTLLTSTPSTKLMLLPQSLNNDAYRLHIEFTLSYITHDEVLDVDVEHNVDTSREVYLRDAFAALTDLTWHNNGHYTLNIKISPNKPILFTVTWSSWGDAHNYFLSN